MQGICSKGTGAPEHDLCRTVIVQAFDDGVGCFRRETGVGLWVVKAM